MRAALRQLTRRGRGVVGLGLVLTVGALALSQRDLLRVGILLLTLPLLSAWWVARTRYRLSSARGLRPPRVIAGTSATAVIRVQNVSRLPSGLLLVEDVVPWALGRPQRFVVDRLESGGRRDVRYELAAVARGRYTIGPVSVQMVDPFGFCRATRRFVTTDVLTVVPATVPLPAMPVGGDWSGLGEARSRAVASAGEDDVIPREYRHGDDLRRVHWKSTARSGELMVRREEHPWRTRATVLLDTRAMAHRGEGPASSFEGAVSAAASVGCHLARRGYAVRVVDADGTMLRGAGAVSESIAGPEAEGPLLDLALRIGDLSDQKHMRISPAHFRNARLDLAFVRQIESCPRMVGQRGHRARGAQQRHRQCYAGQVLVLTGHHHVLTRAPAWAHWQAAAAAT